MEWRRGKENRGEREKMLSVVVEVVSAVVVVGG